MGNLWGGGENRRTIHLRKSYLLWIQSTYLQLLEAHKENQLQFVDYIKQIGSVLEGKCNKTC